MPFLWPRQKRQARKTTPKKSSGPNGGYCERDKKGRSCNRSRACGRVGFCLGDNETETKFLWL